MTTPDPLAVTEPCPACSGKGWRLVPPPARAPGRNVAYGEGPTHGYESTYQLGCRCDLCRAAHREYSRTYKARKKAEVS